MLVSAAKTINFALARTLVSHLFVVNPRDCQWRGNRLDQTLDVSFLAHNRIIVCLSFADLRWTYGTHSNINRRVNNPNECVSIDIALCKCVIAVSERVTLCVTSEALCSLTFTLAMLYEKSRTTILFASSSVEREREGDELNYLRVSSAHSFDQRREREGGRHVSS